MQLPDDHRLTGALSPSRVGDILASGPAVLAFPRSKPSDAMKLGTLIHAACLEGAAALDQFERLPETFDGRTKAGKEIMAEVAARGKIPMKSREYDTMSLCVDAVVNHPTLSHILTAPGIQTEYDIEATLQSPSGANIKCRGRIDAYHKAMPLPWEETASVMLDIKTTAAPNVVAAIWDWRRRFGRERFALYNMMLKQNNQPVTQNYIGFIQTSPPHEAWLVKACYNFQDCPELDNLELYHTGIYNEAVTRVYMAMEAYHAACSAVSADGRTVDLNDVPASPQMRKQYYDETHKLIIEENLVPPIERM